MYITNYLKTPNLNVYVSCIQILPRIPTSFKRKSELIRCLFDKKKNHILTPTVPLQISLHHTIHGT